MIVRFDDGEGLNVVGPCDAVVCDGDAGRIDDDDALCEATGAEKLVSAAGPQERRRLFAGVHDADDRIFLPDAMGAIPAVGRVRVVDSLLVDHSSEASQELPQGLIVRLQPHVTGGPARLRELGRGDFTDEVEGVTHPNLLEERVESRTTRSRESLHQGLVAAMGQSRPGAHVDPLETDEVERHAGRDRRVDAAREQADRRFRSSAPRGRKAPQNPLGDVCGRFPEVAHVDRARGSSGAHLQRQALREGEEGGASG